MEIKSKQNSSGKKYLCYLLQEISDLLTTLGSQYVEDKKAIESLQKRLANECFHLAVLGQFKRGKSTFLNALIGEKLLPTSVVPLTAIPTHIMWGAEPKVRVWYLNEKFEEEVLFSEEKSLENYISQFVTEEENPENCKGVSRVEVFYPSNFLKEGVVLIDTPGIGSTFEHNTETTMNVLSQCDAAIFLVSADPPITKTEIDFLRIVQDNISRLFFIINKIDYLTESEKSLIDRFMQKTLKDKVNLENIEIFSVSAIRGLEARNKQDELLWLNSGMNKITNHLIDFFIKEKMIILQLALAKKAKCICTDVTMRLNLSIRSMEMPLSELEMKLKTFEEELEKAQKQKVVVSDLLFGDKKRLRELIEEQSVELRQKGIKEMNKIIEDTILTMGNKIDESNIREQLSACTPIFFEKELEGMRNILNTEIIKVFSPYQEKSKDIINMVKKTAADIFDIQYKVLDFEEAYEMKHKPYWLTTKLSSSMEIIPSSFFYVLLPQKKRRFRIVNQLKNEASQLVMNNVEKLRWSAIQNLDENFLFFSKTMDEQLNNTIEVTHGVIESVYIKRHSREEIIVSEITNIKNAIAIIEAFEVRLKNIIEIINRSN